MSKHRRWTRIWGVVFNLALVSAAASLPSTAAAIPGFSKFFSPDTIGPGSTTRLQFEINNAETLDAVTDLDFTDVLPAGIIIATPAGAFTDCTNGVVSAPDGGTTISLTGGRVSPDSSCSVSVNTIDTTLSAGFFTNTSGDLTSSEGNSGPATADLTVDTALPGLSKSFVPDSISLGGISRLTLTIDNSAQGATDLFSMQLQDVLPPGMVVATPANATTDCGTAQIPATLTATSGANSISLSASGLAPSVPVMVAGTTCTVDVDVTTDTTGLFVNTTGELTTGGAAAVVSSGFASAVLDVPVEFLAKSFTDDPVAPGGQVNLRFTLNNLDRNNTATSIAFTDPLPAGLVVAAPLDTGTCDGNLSGTTTLSYSGGTLPPGGTCTFSVSLGVPGVTSSGTYTNTTTAVTAVIDGNSVTGNTATDDLVVSYVPVLTKEFTDDPVGAGGDVTLEFTITNSNPGSSLNEIAFDDELTTFLPFPVAVTPASTPDPCGAGSSLDLISFNTDRQRLSLTGGTLPADGSCTFSVSVAVPVGFPNGTYTNTTGDITGLFGQFPVSGLPASDDLVVVSAPSLLKEFTDDPAQPGGTVTLEFTLSHDEFAPGDATGISFTDDLDALAPALSGLAATGLPLANVCGTGNGTLTGSNGDTLLTFSGGTLAPGGTCTFSITLDVPALTPAGNYTNTTSDVTATVLGVTATENPASDVLRMAGLNFTKEFTDDPVLAGSTATLRFTVENIHPNDDATGIFFTDNLGAVLPGLTATGLPPADMCGPGSSVTGTSFLIFTGGNLLSGTTCSFDVTVQVPAAAADGTYNNVTSGLTATLGASSVVFDPAVDTLVINSNLLALNKQFTDDPVAPGGTVTLEFILENLDAANVATGIGFTDDLEAALTGLVATGLPQNDVCGAGSQLTGTSVLSLTGGNLPAGGSCTFSATLQVPVGAVVGNPVINTTGGVTGTINGLAVTGDPATDEMQLVLGLGFSKAFTGPAAAGGTVGLSFTIVNPDATSQVADLSFTDDLDVVIPGLTATGLPLNDVCGAGSALAGTSLLTLTGANLPPGGSCTIPVNLQVPAGAVSGNFVNTTSDLFQFGLPIAGPATADLRIVSPAVEITKTPQSPQVLPGSIATFTITVRNTGDVDLSNLAVSDPLTPSCDRAAGVLPGLVPTAATSYTCDTAPLNADLSNVAMVTADSVGGVVSDSATALVTVDLRQAAVQITKTAQTPQVTAGTAATFTIGLQNTGDVDLTNIAVSDPLSPNCTRTAGQLATLVPGGSTAYTCDSAPLFADLTNVASVTANSVVGAASGSASALVTVIPAETCFTDATATGTGDATLCFTGGGPGCGFLTAANIALEGDPQSPPTGTAPPNLTYPHGLVTFSIGGACSPGFTADFTLTLPSAPPAGTVFSKYGPTTANQTAHWYVLPAAINGNVVSFSITDGGTGDSDLAADGAIVDPAGVAASASAPLPGATRAIPTLNQWGMLLLLVLLTLVGFYAMRRGLNG